MHIQSNTHVGQCRCGQIELSVYSCMRACASWKSTGASNLRRRRRVTPRTGASHVGWLQRGMGQDEGALRLAAGTALSQHPRCRSSRCVAPKPEVIGLVAMKLALSLLFELESPGTRPVRSRSFGRPPKSTPVGFIFRGSNCIVERALGGDACSIDIHYPAIEHVAPADAALFEQRREPAPDRCVLGVDSGGCVDANALHGVHGVTLARAHFPSTCRRRGHARASG